jgi:hypothetical protein
LAGGDRPAQLDYGPRPASVVVPARRYCATCGFRRSRYGAISRRSCTVLRVTSSGRFVSFTQARPNGGSRRNPVVAARFDEGPLHHPICGPCARILLVLPTGGFFEFKTYALAGRLRASWMDARVTKVARISARFSESLARRRFCQNQEKVRSTTQRRGRTTKPLSRRRVTVNHATGATPHIFGSRS